ncbi:PREDICTED: WD repeat-containing protein 6 [Nicrophorus vespilloides]|uniref:tRNA (34-2'-O)-methyltransferase regulator WDR6 n=1 Tax=Nicrophorus vespilloides TaxID=110193 RepID=A0ABM1NHV4_NICVS|nr:PREDICTED: WD repeat-containing protein 6 [Nicrophorus vespilloides]
MALVKFTGKLIKTDVTAIKLLENHLLCGIGAFLHVYSIDETASSLLHKLRVFNGVRIYGIQLSESGNKVLLHAENQIKVYSMDLKSLEFKEIACVESSDWVLRAKWIDSDENIVAISMHNVIEYYTKDLELKKSIVCEERCILYCANLSYNRWEDLVVLSGTVFSEVLIWKPSFDEGAELCKVLRRLTGHNGVLFSIHHVPGMELICTTSDDRSVILWQFDGELQDVLKTNEEIRLKKRMYGHKARVFGCQLLTNHVVSIGEDGFLIVWDLNGNLLRKIEAHQNGRIWSVDCSEERNMIVTGGGDSGVIVFPIKPLMMIDHLEFQEKATPKHLVLLENNDIVLITDKGCVYQMNSESDWCRLMWTFEEFESYSLLEVSSCRKMIALAGFKGVIRVITLNESNGKLELTAYHRGIEKDRTYSLHWLNCKHILTCGIDGLLYLWRIENGALILLHISQLPKIKERWSTAACLCGKGIAVGDRKGNLHYYDLHDLNPMQTFKRTHNHLGITNLHYDSTSGILTTLGRNSRVCKFKLDSHTRQLELLTSDKLPFTWLCSMVQEKRIITAFSGNDFVLWDYKTRRVVLQLGCGGGHRSWDFNPKHSKFEYVYIKNKTINVIKSEWSCINSRDIIKGFHVNEINSLRCLKRDGCIYSLSGGEDTTLRIAKYDGQNFENIDVLKSHLSSIRCLNLYQLEDESKCFLFSAGGRGQIILWQLDFNKENICNQLFSYYEADSNLSEVRVMDLCSAKINDEVLLFAACSDGKIKIYSMQNDELKLAKTLEYKLKCILKVTLLTYEDETIVVSMATDGYLVFWDLKTGYKFGEIKAHISGINSFAFRKMNEDIFLFLTGGDDNALTMNLFKIVRNENELGLETISDYSNDGTHVAQVSGVYLDEEYFMATSLDQKLTIFKYDILNGTILVRYAGVYNSTISDAKGIEVFRSEKSLEIVLYGLGIEIINCNLSV